MFSRKTEVIHRAETGAHADTDIQSSWAGAALVTPGLKMVLVRCRDYGL